MFERTPSHLDPLGRLIFELSKLPGMGEKSATRVAYHLIRTELANSETLAKAIIDARTRTKMCTVCFNWTEEALCRICKNPDRNPSMICVLEKPSDIPSIESTRGHSSGSANGAGFSGVYHVIHGLLSPLEGIGPEQLRIRELFERIKTGPEVTEILFAFNPTVEGEATLLYLSRLLKPIGIKVTQLAYGLPMGGVLEFSDQNTIRKAIDNRVEIR